MTPPSARRGCPYAASVSYLSLVEVRRRVPIVDWDEMCAAVEAAGADRSARVWRFGAVPRRAVFDADVDPADPKALALRAPVLAGEAPPVLVVHSPDHWGSGCDYALWDGAHRFAAGAPRDGDVRAVDPVPAWVGHLSCHCRQIATKRT